MIKNNEKETTPLKVIQDKQFKIHGDYFHREAFKQSIRGLRLANQFPYVIGFPQYI